MRAFLAVSACHNLALIDTYTKKLFLREQAEHGIPLLQMIVLLYNISALLSSPGFEYRIADKLPPGAIILLCNVNNCLRR